jgi:hypothetical protein
MVNDTIRLALRRRRAVLAVIVCLCLVSGCVEGPFERRSPFDPAVEVTMSIRASTDTVSQASPYVVLWLETTPAVSGFEPTWEAPDGGLISVGGGLFRWQPGPAANVTVRARFAWRSATYVIRRVP